MSDEQTFLDHIQLNPEDDAPRLVYADWLTERGDPRGEFIHIQLKLEDEGLVETNRSELKTREEELLSTHVQTWLGSMAALYEKPIKGLKRVPNPFKPGEFMGIPQNPRRPFTNLFTFKRGFLDSVYLKFIEDYQALKHAPVTRFLKKLHINGFPNDNVEVLPSLAECENLRRIQVFMLGTLCFLDDPSEYFRNVNMHTDSWPGVGHFVSQLDALEELYIFGNPRDASRLFSARLQELRVLHLLHGINYPLSVLGNNESAKNVTHLAIHPGPIVDETGAGIGTVIDINKFNSLIRSPYLRNLTHLHFRLTNMGNDCCQTIIDSGILRQLKVLDLRNGNMSDEGARQLAACEDLKNLELLDLGRNALTESGINALEAAGVTLRADDQHDEDDDEYLYEGDWE